MPAVGVPTVKGFMGAVGDYAYGVAGGTVYALVANYTGSGLIGSGVAAALAGTVVKGTRGEVIATVAGFTAGASGELLSLVGFGGNSSPAVADEVVDYI